MVVITWNANLVGRWDALQQDPDFRRPWDVICLQEAGNPKQEAGWRQISRSGGVLNKFGTKEERKTDESCVRRLYEVDSTIGKVYAMHFEWSNRAKNHLIMLSRHQPRFACDMSGHVTSRPIGALKAKIRVDSLQPVVGSPFKFTVVPVEKTILIGSVHLQPYTAANELGAALQWIVAAAVAHKADEWMLAGDFNLDPEQVQRILDHSKHQFHADKTGFVCAPSWPTHKNSTTLVERRLDYVAASAEWLLSGKASDWEPRGVLTARSDHTLQVFKGVRGTCLEFL